MPRRSERVKAIHQTTAIYLASAPADASARVVRSAYDRDPYGASMDDRDEWLVEWWEEDEGSPRV